MLNLLSTPPPQKAYEHLSTKYEFEAGMFIQLITRVELGSKGKFAFKHSGYLLELVKEGNFNLKDPLLLTYAVRLSNEDLALSVTKELVKKGAVIDNILYHSYYNPHITKYLLIEKIAIPTTMEINAVIEKVQKKSYL